VFITMMPRGGNVDVVDADAGAADDLQLRRALQQLRRHLRVRTNGEAVVVADDFGELVLVLAEIRLEVGFDAAVLENLDGGGGKGVGNENARGHGEVLQVWRILLPRGEGVGGADG